MREMGSFSCESESWVSTTDSILQNPDDQYLINQSRLSSDFGLGLENEKELPRLKNEKNKKKNQVLLEGYVESTDEDELTRTKSLTDEDLDELKGCLDLGFGFSYDEIPELCNTLPALELCYSMSQKYMDDHQKSPENSLAVSDSCSSVSSPIANWKISSPGELSNSFCSIFYLGKLGVHSCVSALTVSCSCVSEIAAPKHVCFPLFCL